MRADLLNAVLCYVSGPFAWFTTQPLADQWGDDWNDAPYEHNAGTPYNCQARDRARGREWTIVQIAWEGDFAEPDYPHQTSPYTVEQINAGCAPWLRPFSYSQHTVSIDAGTPLVEFIRALHQTGGRVWLPCEGDAYA